MSQLDPTLSLVKFSMMISINSASTTRPNPTPILKIGVQPQLPHKKSEQFNSQERHVKSIPSALISPRNTNPLAPSHLLITFHRIRTFHTTSNLRHRFLSRPRHRMTITYVTPTHTQYAASSLIQRTEQAELHPIISLNCYFGYVVAKSYPTEATPLTLASLASPIAFSSPRVPRCHVILLATASAGLNWHQPSHQPATKQ
jgi:hypothetical protein